MLHEGEQNEAQLSRWCESKEPPTKLDIYVGITLFEIPRRPVETKVFGHVSCTLGTCPPEGSYCYLHHHFPSRRSYLAASPFVWCRRRVKRRVKCPVGQTAAAGRQKYSGKKNGPRGSWDRPRPSSSFWGWCGFARAANAKTRAHVAHRYPTVVTVAR